MCLVLAETNQVLPSSAFAVDNHVVFWGIVGISRHGSRAALYIDIVPICKVWRPFFAYS